MACPADCNCRACMARLRAALAPLVAREGKYLSDTETDGVAGMLRLILAPVREGLACGDLFARAWLDSGAFVGLMMLTNQDPEEIKDGLLAAFWQGAADPEPVAPGQAYRRKYRCSRCRLHKLPHEMLAGGPESRDGVGWYCKACKRQKKLGEKARKAEAVA